MACGKMINSVLASCVGTGTNSRVGARVIWACHREAPERCILFYPHLRTTMILILAILAATRASPPGLQSPPLVSLNQLHAPPPPPSCDDSNGCRSLGDIVRSCIITIFYAPGSLCTPISQVPMRDGPRSHGDVRDLCFLPFWCQRL
jgi:hypothetical protein